MLTVFPDTQVKNKTQEYQGFQRVSGKSAENRKNPSSSPEPFANSLKPFSCFPH